MEASNNIATEMEEERYNFSRAGHLGPEQMRGLAMMQEQLARTVTHTLSAWLRTAFVATSLSTEQKAFGAFLASVPEVSYVCSLRLEPLGAHGALQLDLALASPIVDVLLGGTGRSGEPRDLTEIEEAILHSVTDMIVRELNKAWESSTLQFALEKRERDSQIQRLMAQTEKSVCFHWGIAMPEASGTLTVCLPAVAVSSALRKMAAQRDRPRRHTDASIAHMQNRLGHAVFPVILRLPTVRLQAVDLSNLQPGQVLRLPLPQTECAQLNIGDTVVFRAQPIRAGEHRGARVTQLVAPTASVNAPEEEEA
ncbi:MAG: flagellar motor switch protein FliM [Acidobacteria bacterium]|nr:flagellar motor switch protein FliM [Acidobacteriota bacterium]